MPAMVSKYPTNWISSKEGLMSSHRVRDLVRGAIALGAVVAGIYVAMPHPTQPSVTAAAPCVVTSPTGTTVLTATPRTDGYYVGVGSDGHYHAIEFKAGNLVRYAFGGTGNSATMPTRLQSDRFVSYDRYGNFAMPAFGENFTMTDDITGNAMVLTVTSTAHCLNGKPQTITVTMHFAKPPTLTA